MPKNPLPQHFVDHWPEVLDEINIQVIPTEYLRGIEISFDDGRVYMIEPEDTSEESRIAMEDTFEELFEMHEEEINGVQFVLDVEKVKRDIKKRTAHFMKKKK